MKLSTLTLAFAALAAAAPSTYVVVEIDNEMPLQEHQTPSIDPENYSRWFDDRRIAHHPDKKLLALTRAYYKTFVELDAEAMREMQTEDYTGTDIPLCTVNIDRDTWYNNVKGFASLARGVNVTAISLAGSSEAGKFSIVEDLLEFRLTVDPPPAVAPTLPPGAKAGDHVAMIVLSTFWWNGKGKVTRELQYGRLVWENFSLEPFLKGRKTEDEKKPYFDLESGL